MTERRPRNEVSRHQGMSLRAAELLDEGATDAVVAATLSAEFKRVVKARAVRSFRKADYEPVAKERLVLRDSAKRTELILNAARGAGATFAEAATDLLSKMFYDAIRVGATDESFDAVAVGKTLAKFQELDIQRIKAETAAEKVKQANAAVDVAQDDKLTPEQKAAAVKKIFGIVS